MTVNKVIYKSITVDAKISKVWDFLTRPALIKLWMADEEINVISEWKEGSSIIFRGKLHGKDLENTGTILQLKREAVFSYTNWSSLSGPLSKPEDRSIITFTLSKAEDNTLLHFTQSNFIAETSYEHSNFYWTVTLDLFKKLVEGS